MLSTNERNPLVCYSTWIHHLSFLNWYPKSKQHITRVTMNTSSSLSKENLQKVCILQSQTMEKWKQNLLIQTVPKCPAIKTGHAISYHTCAANFILLILTQKAPILKSLSYLEIRFVRSILHPAEAFIPSVLLLYHVTKKSLAYKVFRNFTLPEHLAFRNLPGEMRRLTTHNIECRENIHRPWLLVKRFS